MKCKWIKVETHVPDNSPITLFALKFQRFRMRARAYTLRYSLYASVHSFQMHGSERDSVRAGADTSGALSNGWRLRQRVPTAAAQAARTARLINRECKIILNVTSRQLKLTNWLEDNQRPIIRTVLASSLPSGNARA